MDFQDSNPGTQSSQPQSLDATQAHNLLTSFNTFLVISIHNILFYRSIYPQATFLSAKAYNLPVHQNRHPKVCSWIQDAVDAVAAQLATGEVSRVAVVIHAAPTPPAQKQAADKKPAGKPAEKPKDSTSTTSGGSSSPEKAKSAQKPPPAAPGAVLERWMFDVSSLPAWPGGPDAMKDYSSALQAQREEKEDGLGDPEEEAAAEEEDDDENDDADEAEALEDQEVNWADVDEQFRGAVARMANTAERMGPLPKGCTFTVAVELKEHGKAPIGHPQPWIPSPANLQTARNGGSKVGKDIGGAKSTPIRSVEAGPLFFECWVEEGKAKLAAQEKPGKEA